MKKNLLIALLLSLTTGVFAGLPAYEPFADATAAGGSSYSVGSPNWHQTNNVGDVWTATDSAAAAANTIYITNINLTYTGLPTSTGNSIALRNVAGPGGRMSVGTGISTSANNGTKVYYSMLLVISNLANLSTTGDFCWGLNNGQTTDQTSQPSDLHARVYFKKSGAGYLLGLSKNGAVITNYDSTVHAVGETVFLVVSYEIVTTNASGATTTTNDSCRMWINPSAASFGTDNPPVEKVSVLGVDANETTITTFVLENKAATCPNLMIIDDFRMGTNWSQVTGAAAIKTFFPANTSVAFQATLALTNKVTGSAALTYAWQFNGTNIANATTSSLNIPNMADINAGVYTCIASSALGSPVTNSTTVTVTGDPQIVSQTLIQNVPTLGSASFNVNAIGTPTLTYIWMQNGNALSDGTDAAGTVFSGTHTATLNLSNIGASESGSTFTCGVTNGLNIGIVSTNAVLTVQDPVVVSGPNNATANYLGAANFTITAAGTSPFTYQWFYNGNPLSDGPSPSTSGATIAGAHSNTLVVSGVTYLDSGSSYSVVVTNANNSTAGSSSGTLTVLDPYIATQPTKQTNAAGGTAAFSIVAPGSPTLAYQWYQNNNPLSDGNTIPNGGTISGASTATLNLSSITSANAGNYYVNVTSSSSGQSTNSTTNSLTVVNPITFTTALKPIVERAGEHAAFVVSVSGSTPTYQWMFGSSPIPGATQNSLVFSNLQSASNGTYTVLITNVFSSNSASATLNVLDSTALPLLSTNLVVVRVGDGAQTLSAATGNTIYLDQYTTNGTYVSSAQIPDTGTGQPYGTGSLGTIPGSPALIAQGAGADALNGPMLTLSGGNQQYLGLAAYCLQYPFTGSPDVTFSGGNGSDFARGLATVNAFGAYTLAYTNSGFYSGGNHTIRATVTLDGTNFWAVGQASAGGIKFANTTVSSYAGGNGIPTITSSGPGARMAQLIGTNLIFSDNAGAGGPGLYISGGPPEPAPGGTSPSSLLLSTGSQPADFAFSPDGQTIYVADLETFQGTNVPAGGIDRYDTNFGGGWSYSYTIAPLNNNATNGAQALAVYFPPNITSWGPGVTGAVIHATTVGTTTNSLVQIVDNGPASPSVTLATAGPNQSLRGLRFGPAAIPVIIASQPQSQTNFPNNNVTFSVAASGSTPIFYQWQLGGVPIPGATQSSYTTNNVSLTASGNIYTVVVSNLIPSSATSSNAVLTVTAGAPTFTAGISSFVETVGDHLAFTPVVAGSLPISAQWYHNNTSHPIPGATNINLVLTNIQTSDSGPYLLYVANAFGSNQSAGILTVTTTTQPLSPLNLVVSRIGDGIQPLSGVTGNTLYLDQYTTNGAYVNTTQVPDEGVGQAYGTGSTSSADLPFGSQALIVVGGNAAPFNDAPFTGLLSRSEDSQTINFAGFVEAYPFLGVDVTAASAGGNFIRGVGSVNAFGTYATVYTNTGDFAAGGHQVHSAVTADQTNYWATGQASSAGVKYLTPSFEPASGAGIPALGGTINGTRCIQIFNHNVVYTDSAATPPGLYAFNGEPKTAGTAVTNLVIAETNSPLDFMYSPDGNTIYISDNGTFTGTNNPTGGIQRYDADLINGGYAYRYTLATGAGSTAGARGLTADFGSHITWGMGVTGAKLYATTAEFSGNRLIVITDNGPASTAATLATAPAGATLSGVKFGPAALPVTIASQPQNQFAITGSGAAFTVGVVGTPPIYYQWQFNGTNLPGATQSTLTVSPAQAVLPGSYTVLVSNSIPSSAVGGPASISFVPVLGFYNNGAGWSMNSTAGSGLPIYNYNGTTNEVELTQGVSSQASSTFYNYPVYVGGFVASWTYQVINPAGSIADGAAFVVQNDARGPGVLGNNGGALGYGGITNSAALEFNIYAGSPLGLGYNLRTNGTTGTNFSSDPVSLNSGDPIDVKLKYLNGVASLTLVDEIATNSFTTNVSLDIVGAVGGTQAYVGFTGADGGVTSTQVVSNFVFTSIIGLSPVATTGNSLIFGWPTGVGGYVLQQNPGLTPNNWTPSSAVVGVTNGMNQAAVPLTGSNLFFRLMLP